MANQLQAELVRVTDRVAAELRLATREAVNHSAELVVVDARRRVQAAIGPEQRMSRVTARMRNGRRSVVTAETVAKGGTRINPYYRTATSTTNPVALIGVRGPAHYIEHPRRGGYLVKPRRPVVVDADIADAIDELQAELFGRERAARRRSGERLPRRPALKIAGDYRAAARPGPITTPLAPITKAFAAAPQTIAAAARARVEQGIRRRLGEGTR